MYSDMKKVRSIAQVISNDELPFTTVTIGDGNVVFNNDWIILKLASPVTLNGNVQPACLPPDSDFLPLTASSEQCWTSGWGALSFDFDGNFSFAQFNLCLMISRFFEFDVCFQLTLLEFFLMI